jgi:hypothetical protein
MRRNNQLLSIAKSRSGEISDEIYWWRSNTSRCLTYQAWRSSLVWCHIQVDINKSVYEAIWEITLIQNMTRLERLCLNSLENGHSPTAQCSILHWHLSTIFVFCSTRPVLKYRIRIIVLQVCLTFVYTVCLEEGMTHICCFIDLWLGLMYFSSFLLSSKIIFV